jgi:hypothetical protein
MTMQSLCHARGALAMLCASALSVHSVSALADQRVNDFPTQARVEYVQECMTRSGGQLASLYQCSCVIDEIAKQFSYDEYVEAWTFSRYASLGGDRGGLFRDPEEGRAKAKRFEAVEKDAEKRCGIHAPK